jgi:hypothetical protein
MLALSFAIARTAKCQWQSETSVNGIGTGITKEGTMTIQEVTRMAALTKAIAKMRRLRELCLHKSRQVAIVATEKKPSLHK